MLAGRIPVVKYCSQPQLPALSSRLHGVHIIQNTAIPTNSFPDVRPAYTSINSMPLPCPCHATYISLPEHKVKISVRTKTNSSYFHPVTCVLSHFPFPGPFSVPTLLVIDTSVSFRICLELSPSPSVSPSCWKVSRLILFR